MIRKPRKHDFGHRDFEIWLKIYALLIKYATVWNHKLRIAFLFQEMLELQRVGFLFLVLYEVMSFAAERVVEITDCYELWKEMVVQKKWSVFRYATDIQL